MREENSFIHIAIIILSLLTLTVLLVAPVKISIIVSGILLAVIGILVLFLYKRRNNRELEPLLYV